MSGVAGAERIRSRKDFDAFVLSYQSVVSKFPGFVSVTVSGSYNSDITKQDFGDIDLITHINTTLDKPTIKKKLQEFFHNYSDTVIVPFTSKKYQGRRSYNSGEIVTVRYHDTDLDYSVQVDNIIALSKQEVQFKKQFLDMPAAVQGLVLGLAKVSTLETQPEKLFDRIGITKPEKLSQDQEYEFNLSSNELQLRKVTYFTDTFKQASREVVWTSTDYSNLEKLLYQYKLNVPFIMLLTQINQTIKNPRSKERIKGLFSSMVSVKSGEVGTAKGIDKEKSLTLVQQTFSDAIIN
jgi:hypothetical protein